MEEPADVLSFAGQLTRFQLISGVTLLHQSSLRCVLSHTSIWEQCKTGLFKLLQSILIRISDAPMHVELQIFM